MSEKLKPVYDRVKALMEANPEYRDNDNMLVSKIWWEEMFGNKPVKRENCDKSLYDFLRNYTNGHITPADYITRTRRIIEKDCSELRGKTYNQRHNIESEKVKQEVKELSFPQRA